VALGDEALLYVTINGDAHETVGELPVKSGITCSTNTVLVTGAATQGKDPAPIVMV